MRIIEIQALDNGAHRNQTIMGELPLPDGWAVVPDDMETHNFPFGEVEATDVDAVMTVTKWTPGIMPEPEPEPPTPKTNAELEAENKLLKAQVEALSGQIDFQEECLVEMASIVYG